MLLYASCAIVRAGIYNVSISVRFNLKLLQRMTLVNFVVWLSFILIGESGSLAQSSAKLPDGPLTLDQAVDFAIANYPAVRASMERMLATKEGAGRDRRQPGSTDSLASHARLKCATAHDDEIGIGLLGG